MTTNYTPLKTYSSKKVKSNNILKEDRDQFLTNSIKSLKKALKYLNTTNKRIQKLIRLFIKLYPGLFNY